VDGGSAEARFLFGEFGLPRKRARNPARVPAPYKNGLRRRHNEPLENAMGKVLIVRRTTDINGIRARQLKSGMVGIGRNFKARGQKSERQRSEDEGQQEARSRSLRTAEPHSASRQATPC